MKMRLKIFVPLLTFALAAILAVTTSWLYRRSSIEVIAAENKTSLTAELNSLSNAVQAAIRERDLPFIQARVVDAASSPGTTLVIMIDDHDTIHASSRLNLVGRRLAPEVARTAGSLDDQEYRNLLEAIAAARAQQAGRVLRIDHDSLLIGITPVPAFASEGSPWPARTGAIIKFTNLRQMAGYSAWNLIKYSTIFLFIIGMLCLLFMWVLKKHLSDRIESLIRYMHKVETGETPEQIRDSGADEISAMVRALNRMVAERQEVFRQLADREASYQTLTEQVMVGIFRCNAAGECLFVNQRLCTMTGYPPEQFYGYQWAGHIHPEDRERVMATWTTMLESGQPYLENQRIRKADGEYIWVLGQATPERTDAGRITGFLGTVTDITANKEIEHNLEAARQAAVSASQAKTAFLANMSHEFRTPLNAILGFADVLRTSWPTLDEASRDRYLETILRNGRSLTGLVDDLLDIARIESADVQPNLQAIAPAAFLDDLRELVREKLSKRTLRFDTEVARDDLMATDLNWLRTICLNLATNAIKFTPDGGTIGIRAEVSPATIHIAVSDTGIGISPDKQGQIFERFYQVESDFRRTYQGAGLGLALAQALARKLGGTITVDSVPGRGSRFEVTLPNLAANLMVGTTAAPPLLPPSENCLVRKDVLLIEDNEANAELFRIVLERAGATVSTAPDGRSGIDLFTGHDFDVVLLDIGLPDIDGMGVLREIRQREKSKHTPVIALTAHAMKDHRELFLAGGCDGYIAKPVTVETLPQQVLQIMRQATPA